MRTLHFLLAATLLAVPGIAQSRAELKQELKTKESQATDAQSLMAVATWAKEKGLLTDYQRLLNKVLKLDPENEGAKEGLGLVKYNGEWMPQAKADVLIKKEREAAFEAQGLQNVDGVWVSKEEAADAKEGRFRHEGEIVSRSEKLAFAAGKVRHPQTAEFIAKEDLPKAQQGLFPLGGDRWGTRDEADKYHSDPSHPWALRSTYAIVLTTLPLDKSAELQTDVDASVEEVLPLFGGRKPGPGHRPVVIVCATTDEYKEFGSQVGDEYSAYGAFLASQNPSYSSLGIDLPSRAAVANGGEKDWGPYYARHAAGLAYAQAIAEELEVEFPLWLRCGVASLAERHRDAQTAKWFGQQHLSKGGVKDLKKWFEDFKISGELTPQQLEFNIYQAGLALNFAMNGGDKDATKAAQALTSALTKDARSVAKATGALEQVLGSKEEELRGYLKDILQKS